MLVRPLFKILARLLRLVTHAHSPHRKLSVDYTKLTPSERKKVRNQYVALQEGICPVCKNPLASQPAEFVLKHKINWEMFPDNFLKHPVHLHHDHNTGMTIGAVHAYCNAYSWQYHGT